VGGGERVCVWVLMAGTKEKLTNLYCVLFCFCSIVLHCSAEWNIFKLE